MTKLEHAQKLVFVFTRKVKFNNPNCKSTSNMTNDSPNLYFLFPKKNVKSNGNVFLSSYNLLCCLKIIYNILIESQFLSDAHIVTSL